MGRQARRHDRRVLGAVVCLPLERGAAIEPEIARVAKLKTVRGVRRLIQNQPDPEFMLKPGFLEALRLLPKYNLSFDACIFHPQMPNTLAMMRQCPEVSFILDHIGKPGIKAGLIDPWRAHIREMAALPNVVCKLSGVTTEADLKTWTRDQLRPYIDHVIACFGPDRILYGGDWPVSELAGSYLQWLSTLDWATALFARRQAQALPRQCDQGLSARREMSGAKGFPDPAASRRPSKVLLLRGAQRTKHVWTAPRLQGLGEDFSGVRSLACMCPAY